MDKEEKAAEKAATEAAADAVGDAAVIAAFTEAVQLASRYESPEVPLREFIRLIRGE